MSSPEPNSLRARLAARLRELRVGTGKSGNQFARGIGWQQSRVSKLETGVQLPTGADLDSWCIATEASSLVRDELERLAGQARTEYSTWRAAYRRSDDAAKIQADIGEREQRATATSEFWPAMIPGLLQTADYARDVLTLDCGPRAHGATGDDIDRITAERIRRQEVLYETGRRARFVLGEAALWTRFGSTETLAAQLDRLTGLADLATVELSIVPFTTPLPVYPLGMFKLYDTRMVMIESVEGEQLVFDPEQIAAYEAYFDQLVAAASSGEQAVKLVRRIITQLRQR